MEACSPKHISSRIHDRDMQVYLVVIEVPGADVEEEAPHPWAGQEGYDYGGDPLDNETESQAFKRRF